MFVVLLCCGVGGVEVMWRWCRSDVGVRRGCPAVYAAAIQGEQSVKNTAEFADWLEGGVNVSRCV